MAKFLKHVVVGKVLEVGLVPVFYEGDLETAKKIVQACVFVLCVHVFLERVSES